MAGRKYSNHAGYGKGGRNTYPMSKMAPGSADRGAINPDPVEKGILNSLRNKPKRAKGMDPTMEKTYNDIKPRPKKKILI